MSVSVNASPIKVYILLFALLIICYGAFVIHRSLNKQSIDVEHFVEEHPDYRFRMETIKIFDLYLNRNPTPDEINKYASLRNEQEILLAFFKDFDVNATDLDKEKLKHYASKEVNELRENAHNNIDVFVEDEYNSEFDSVDRSLGVSSNDVESFQGDQIMISRKAYTELQAKVTDLNNHIAKLAMVNLA